MIAILCLCCAAGNPGKPITALSLHRSTNTPNKLLSSLCWCCLGSSSSLLQVPVPATIASAYGGGSIAAGYSGSWRKYGPPRSRSRVRVFKAQKRMRGFAVRIFCLLHDIAVFSLLPNGTHRSPFAYLVTLCSRPFPCARLRSLPFDATLEDILILFQGLVVIDVVLVGQGEAFVIFANPMDYQMALQRYVLLLL